MVYQRLQLKRTKEKSGADINIKNSDFRYADFDKIFGSKRNMLYKAIEIGSIHKGFFNPLTDVSDIKKNKYKQKWKNRNNIRWC